MIIDAYFSPEKARLLPENSLEHSRTWIALNGLQHSIFHYAPTLKNHTHIFEPFLAWMYSKQILIKWDLHIHLLEWLCLHPASNINIDECLKKELLIAAVTRWSLNGIDHLGVKSIMVASRHYQQVAVRLTKGRYPSEAGKISVLKVPETLFPMQTSYATSLMWEWDAIQWQELK